MRFILPTVIAILALVGMGGYARAQCTSYVNLTNGTTADATQVMSNFNCAALTGAPYFTGNMGLGTTSPNATLDVRGNLAIGPTSGAVANQQQITSDGSGGSMRLLSPDGIFLVTGGGTSKFSVSQATTCESGSSVCINSSGYVGIGTTSPTVLLDVVNGQVRSNENFIINGTSGLSKVYAVETGGVLRWLFGADSTSESGSNAGSNFTVQSFTDAGVALGTPLGINRASGLITFYNQANFDAAATFNASASIGGNVAGAAQGLTVYNNATGTGTVAQVYMATGTSNNSVNSVLYDGSAPNYLIAAGSAVQKFTLSMPNYNFEGLSYGTPWLSMATGNVAVDAVPNTSYAFYVNGATGLNGAVTVTGAVTASGTVTAPSSVMNNFIRVKPTTIAGLATSDPSPSAGDRSYVTNADACTFNSAVVHTSGSISCPVVYNGSAWVAG